MTTAVRTYRGGRTTRQDQPADGPKPKPRFPCFATGCPMPGTIFPGAGQGGTGDKDGNCAWHYGAQPADIPRITRILHDLQPVAYEVNEARRALTGDAAYNPAKLAEMFATAAARLIDAVPQWPELAPGFIVWPNGTVTNMREDYADWCKRLQKFMGTKVAEVVTAGQRKLAA